MSHLCLPFSMPHVVLLDNYDSFTWNLYEYLCREGAQVSVYRNDKVTLAEIEALKPDLIMISPGPGHPSTDSGISCEVVRHFAGKLPIFGVCMGLQCIVHTFGGTVEYAGEIVHGKTSPLEHTNQGVFEGVKQGSLATRYHSLAARQLDLPVDFEVTATSPGGVIQGVRHKTLAIEGVQFHPESIMSDGGHLMIRNFLAYRGGAWKSMPAIIRRQASETNTEAPTSILDSIYSERRKQIGIESQLPGHKFDDLSKSLALGIAPPLVDFAARLRASPHKMSLLAEIKRASPSKGDIALDVHAASQALKYACAGAAAISVLTEPKWFKGSIEDLRQVRLAVDKLENRPAILRKEFVFDKYQILEARLMGADTVLLIVKMLNEPLLRELYNYSKSLGMEPLVEVSNAPEMERAVALGSKVIGVNNRDLHSFVVDMSTTSAIAATAPKDTILAALSGISSRKQVDEYASQGVGAVLVGEALMRAADPTKFVLELVGNKRET